MALKATLIFCAIVAMGFAMELHEDAHSKKSDKENENSFLSAPPQKLAEKQGYGVLPAASAGPGPAGHEAAVKNERDARYFGFYVGSGRGYGGYGFGGGYGGYGGWGGYGGGYGGYGGWGGRGWGGGWYGR